MEARFHAMPDLPTSSLQHLLINASAGSGKTYQLARRYAQLLTLGACPEGIAAMTFTRKAAGEFFNRILRRLAELARHPDTAAAFFEGVEPPPLTSTDYRLLLRKVTRSLQKLRLGTLDSFFAGMVRCFPLELGLAAGARVMQEDETALARAEALDALLADLHADEDRHALQMLTEAYKQATFGAGEKSVEATLEQWAREGLELWQDSPEGSWGDAERIWQGKLPTVKPLAEVVAQVRAAFCPPHDPGKDLLEETLDAVLQTQPGMTLPKRTKELLEKLAEQWPELERGRGELMWMRRRITLDPGAARAWQELAQQLMLREYLVRAQRTRGLAQVTSMLAAHYQRQVRARGRLSFADVQRVLAHAVRERSPWLGFEDGDLWYRLDSRHEHWLLDEFQDTSRTQWQVLAALVDEVIQDREGTRSFFAVGDPKQSIYLWRQAEPGLFQDIQRAYPAQAEGGLHMLPLSQSFRSAQPVLDTVNAVFGDSSCIESLLPAGCLKGFAFQTHTAAKAGLTGHAALLCPTKNEAQPDTDSTTVLAALLQELQPLEHGLSCAVLVRSNKDATELAEALRQQTGMEVVCESDQHPCTDNAITLALLSILQLAAHPSDTQALEHLRMTPLWPLLEKQGQGWRYHISAVQRQILEEGFAAFAESWLGQLRELPLSLDAFHTLRLSQFADIAAEFDAHGSRDVDAFLRHTRDYPLRVRGSPQAIQVMTVHASKGLEFDIVMLPRLDSDAMDQLRREDWLISRDAQGVRWVLQTPLRVFAEFDPCIQAELTEAKRRGAFESLCRLYVAMTRAKRALYLIVEPKKKSATAVRESTLLRAALGDQSRAESPSPLYEVEWQTGDPSWHLRETRKPSTEAPTLVLQEPLGEILRRTQPMPRRRTPSGEESFRVKGAVLFSAGREPGRRLGTCVHELFSDIEWLPEMSTLDSRWLAARRLSPDDMNSDADTTEAMAYRLVKAVCDSEAGRAVFLPSSRQAEVWRERPFDLIMAGEWISGVFDRVIVDRDTDGRPVSAWIVDYKTDEVSSEAAIQEKIVGYAPQLALYRRAVARLTGVSLENIRTSLLLVRACRLVEA
jgi:ATP-dependent exoDNAse (exonuclease V) beta subunit